MLIKKYLLTELTLKLPVSKLVRIYFFIDDHYLFFANLILIAQGRGRGGDNCCYMLDNVLCMFLFHF